MRKILFAQTSEASIRDEFTGSGIWQAAGFLLWLRVITDGPLETVTMSFDFDTPS